MRLEKGSRLTEYKALEIVNEGERNFALACLEVGCDVYYQIPVGISNIDFLVVNPKANTEGKLVEITMEKKANIDKKFIKKKFGKSRKKIPNETGARKHRQIESMKESGHKWTILYDEEVRRLRKP